MFVKTALRTGLYYKKNTKYKMKPN